MKNQEITNTQLLRRAAELARSVSATLDSCYQAHLKATGQKEAA